MSDEVRTLGESLIQKFTNFGFKVSNFTHTKEAFLSDKSRKNNYSSISGVGKQERMAELQEALNDQEKEVEMDLDFGPQVGEQCPDLPVKHSINGEDKLLTFTAEDPKTYLIDFWATWCGPCQGPMNHNQEMLHNNPDWEGKAEIIAISLDDGTEAVNKRIAERGWNKVTSYWAGPEGFSAVAPVKFNVNGIPKCVLVKAGKILWSGHPSERKLEQDINDLNNGKEIVLSGSAEEGSNSPQITGEEHETLMDRAREKLDEFARDHPELKKPEVVSVYNFTLKPDSEPSSKYSFYVLGGFLSKQKAIGEKFFADMNEIFPNAINRLRFQETSEIARGEACSLCSKPLAATEIQYLCVFCNPKHYHCQECHVKEREGVASHRLAHPHHLYWISEKADKLDEIIFGADKIRLNIAYDEEPADRTHRGVGCDNRHDSEAPCPGNVVGIRYKCAHCPDYDYCENCFNKWAGGASESMIATAKNMGHLQSHVFIVMHYP